MDALQRNDVAQAFSQKRSPNGRPGRLGFRDGPVVLPPPPLPAADHPACGLALSPFHLELPRRRGAFGRAGLEVSYESVRRWVLKFGPAFARRLRGSRPRPSDRWHLDEMVVRIAGKRMYLWRAVDHEGEVLEV